MDRRTDACMEARTHGCADNEDRRTDRWVDGCLGRKAVGRTHGRTDERMGVDGFMDGCTNRQVFGQMDTLSNGLRADRLIDQTIWMHGCMHGWTGGLDNHDGWKAAVLH